MRKSLFFIPLFVSLLALASCETTTTTFSEGISQKVLQEKEDKLIQEDKKLVFEIIDLLGQSATIFYLVKEEVPVELVNKVKDQVLKRVKEAAFFTDLLSEQQARPIFTQERRMKQAREIYLDSLANVSVSDKDLSNPLGRLLQVENFLVYQLDSWPCASCVSKNIIGLKLRLVEASTGDIIWTGISQRSVLSPDSENLDVALQELTAELMENFYFRFKRKWHIQRFQNLAMITN